MLGVGDVARRDYLPEMRRLAGRVELVAACGRTPARVEVVADQYGIPARYTDYTRMLAEIAAARRVGLAGEPFPLVLGGGVLLHPTRLLTDALVGRVRAEAPSVRVITRRREPVIGTLLLAIVAAGAPVTAATRANLDRLHPPPAQFAT